MFWKVSFNSLVTLTKGIRRGKLYLRSTKVAVGAGNGGRRVKRLTMSLPAVGMACALIVSNGEESGGSLSGFADTTEHPLYRSARNECRGFPVCLGARPVNGVLDPRKPKSGDQSTTASKTAAVTNGSTCS